MAESHSPADDIVFDLVSIQLLDLHKDLKNGGGR